MVKAQLRGLLVMLALLSGGVEAQAQGGVDGQLRRPSAGPNDTLLVSHPSVMAHLETGISVDAEWAGTPIEVEGRGLVESRGAVTVVMGFGLFDRVQATVAIPLVFQSGPGLQGVEASGPALAGGAAGDARVALRVHLAALGPLDLGASGWFAAPTGDAESFTGARTASGAVLGLAAVSAGVFSAEVELGVRLRGEEELLSSSVGSELQFGAAAGFDLFDRQVGLRVGALGLAGFSSSYLAGQWMAEVRGRFFEDRRFQVALGIGTGLTAAVTSPDVVGALSLRFVPMPGGNGASEAFAGSRREQR